MYLCTMYDYAEWFSQCEICASLLNRNIPFPCDLEVGFMIHTLRLSKTLCIFLNSSAKMTYSEGRI